VIIFATSRKSFGLPVKYLGFKRKKGKQTCLPFFVVFTQRHRAARIRQWLSLSA
jgi:hypothetical protein